MNIKYPRDSKILHVKNTKKSQIKDAENYKKTTEMQLNLDELQTKVNGLNQTVDAVSQSAHDIDDALAQISTNTTGISTLNQSVTSLQTAVDTNSQNTSNLQSTVGTNSQNITALQTAVGTNTNNISALQTGKQNKLTAGANVTIDANNVISATGGGGDTTELEEQVDANSDDILKIKSQINILKAKVNQNDATYDQTIYKETDTYERELEIVGTTEVVGPTVLFAIEPTLTISNAEDVAVHQPQVFVTGEIKFKASATCNLNIKLYNNLTILSTKNLTITANDVNVTKIVDFDINYFASGGENKLYAVITNQTSGISTTILKQTFVISAPNVTIINKIHPFDVTYNYITNKYYFSDCRTGYAKVAEIDADDFTNLSDLIWTQTDIEAQNYKVYYIGATDNTSTTLGKKYAIITHKNNTVEVLDLTDTAYHYYFAEGTFCVEPYCTKHNYSMLNYVKVYKNTCSAQYYALNQNMSVTSTITFNNSDNIANVYANKNNKNYLAESGTWPFLLVTNTIGNIKFYKNRTQPISPEYVKKFVEDAKIYTEKYTVNVGYDFSILIKQFDKYYFIDARNATTTLVCNSESLVGEYEDLFYVGNNKFFAVLNNQLQYIILQ